MTFWTFLILLVLVAGVVSYLGDTIAKKVGKRHWRLFGLRPRQTGTLVAVGTGVLIGLGAFGAFFLVNDAARETILQAEDVRNDRNRLKTEVDSFTDRLTQMKADAARAFAENNQLQEDNQFFVRSNKQLAKDLETNLVNQREIKAELEKVLIERERLRRESERLQKANDRQTALVVKLEKDQLTLKNDQLALKNETTALLAQVDAGKRQLKTVEDASKNARQNYSKLVNQTATLAQKLQKMQDDKETLEGNVAALTDAKSVALIGTPSPKPNTLPLQAKIQTLQTGLNQSQSQNKLLIAALSKSLAFSGPFLSIAVTQDSSLQKIENIIGQQVKKLGLKGVRMVEFPQFARGATGLVLVRVSGVLPDGIVQIRTQFIPREKLFDEGEVIVSGTLVLPNTNAELARKLDQLTGQAKEKLIKAGADASQVRNYNMGTHEIASFVSRAGQINKKKGYKVSLVAERSVMNTDTPVFSVRISD